MGLSFRGLTHLQAIREAIAGEAVRAAVEINDKLCEQLKAQASGADIHHADFLTLLPETCDKWHKCTRRRFCSHRRAGYECGCISPKGSATKLACFLGGWDFVAVRR